MKRVLLSSLLAVAAVPSMAAVTLVPTLTAPAELQLGEHEVYKLSVTNSGNTAASGVSIRLNLASGQAPAGPWPSVCSQVGPDFVCNPGSIPARKSRDYVIVLKAPAVQQTFTHRLTASGTAAVTAISAPTVTNYRSFGIPITGNATDLWELRSCSGGTTGVAYNLCPAGSEVVGDAKLHAGGVLEDLLEGMPATWLQTSPQTLRLDTPAGPGYDAWFAQLTPINATCFRGAGQTVPLGIGQLPYRTANKICRK
jgi:hypothetical protein